VNVNFHKSPACSLFHQNVIMYKTKMMLVFSSTFVLSFMTVCFINRYRNFCRLCKSKLACTTRLSFFANFTLSQIILSQFI